jgi:choline monooxygenase
VLSFAAPVLTSRGRLPHVLRPDQYFSEEQHALELERLFRPAWHCIAITDEIPRDGDYVTRDLLGTPVLVRNQRGAVTAFLNVCAHRHGPLARDACGNAPRIRCSYHGWEYDAEGRVCTIPEPENFLPVQRGEFVLRRFRTATLGRLVFVSLADKGESLETFLGPEMTAELQAVFDAPELVPVAAWDPDYACNWKVLMENTLEDYHVPIVHRATFGELPRREDITHTMGERFVSYEHRAPGLATWSVRWLTRRLRPRGRLWYVQHLGYPSLIFAGSSLSGHLHVTLPTSPNTCRTMVRVFLARGAGIGPALLHGLIRRPFVKLTHKVLLEDLRISNDLQRGLPASPHRGVIGAREERVFAFQSYVAARTGQSQGDTAISARH